LKFLILFLAICLICIQECQCSELEQSPRLEELIEFGTSTNEYSRKLCADVILDWQPEDRQHLLTLLERIKEACPGLIEAAAAPGKLLLVLTEEPPCTEVFGQQMAVCAKAHPQAIQFSKKLLRGNYEDWLIVRSVIHELVHEADTGNLISYSPDWCRLALPRLKLVRTAFEKSEKSNTSYATLFLKSRADNVLPTLLAAKNLTECLAECYAEYTCRNFEIDKKSGAVFYRLCHPSKQDQDYNMHYKSAINLSISGKTEAAIVEFKKATIIAPLAPEPQLRLGYCYCVLGNNKNGVECFRKSKHLLEILQVPDWEDRLHYVLNCLQVLSSN
jgi:tetratricopeptide (TPR) repeat protein